MLSRPVVIRFFTNLRTILIGSHILGRPFKFSTSPQIIHLPDRSGSTKVVLPLIVLLVGARLVELLFAEADPLFPLDVLLGRSHLVALEALFVDCSILHPWLTLPHCSRPESFGRSSCLPDEVALVH